MPDAEAAFNRYNALQLGKLILSDIASVTGSAQPTVTEVIETAERLITFIENRK